MPETEQDTHPGQFGLALNRISPPPAGATRGEAPWGCDAWVVRTGAPSGATLGEALNRNAPPPSLGATRGEARDNSGGGTGAAPSGTPAGATRGEALNKSAPPPSGATRGDASDRHKGLTRGADVSGAFERRDPGLALNRRAATFGPTAGFGNASMVCAVRAAAARRLPAHRSIRQLLDELLLGRRHQP